MFPCAPSRLLHVAALWDNAELLEDLLNGDELSCLDARDSWGRSALHAAATNADSKCLRILLQSGAKVGIDKDDFLQIFVRHWLELVRGLSSSSAKCQMEI